MADVEFVTLVHKGGKGLEEVKGREIRVPITSVRVHAKSGWEPKRGEDAKAVAAAEKAAEPAKG